jgi:hypothetical protein
MVTVAAFIAFVPVNLAAQGSEIDWDEATACFVIKAEDVHQRCPGTTGSVNAYASWRKHAPDVVHRARDVLESIAINSASAAARRAAVISLVVRGNDRPEAATLERLERIYRASRSPNIRMTVIRQAPTHPDPVAFSRLMEVAVRETRPGSTRDVVASLALERLMKEDVEGSREAVRRLKADVEELPGGRARQTLKQVE